VGTIDDTRVCQDSADEFAIHQFTDHFDGAEATFNCVCQSTVDASVSTVYLQIYNRTNDEWDTLDSDNTTSASTNITLQAVSVDLTDYKDGNSLVTCRVYQEAK